MALHTEFVAGRSGSKALFIALHGLGDSVAGYRWLPQGLGLPWLNYLLVNAPDPYYGGFSWYDFTGDQKAGVERSRRLLLELLDAQRTQGWLPEQTVLFGFSQGCLMTVDVGFRYPHKLAGLVGVSGYVHEPEALLRERPPEASQQRMLFTHGSQDPLIPQAGVHEQVRQLQAGGLSIEWRVFPKVHTIIEEELELIRTFVESRLKP